MKLATINAEHADSTQEAAISAFMRGVPVFLTGPAGTGKSWTLREMVRRAGRYQRISLTAMTGVAASIFGGCTLHSWAGLGMANAPADVMIKQGWMNKRGAKRIQNAHILAIDEISMCDGFTLDLLDQLCRAARRDSRPFGGIQMVFIGDLAQLPPVEARDKGWCFESNAWSELWPDMIELAVPHRQVEGSLTRVLDKIRIGVRDEEVMSLCERARQRFFDADHEIRMGLDTARAALLRHAPYIVTHNDAADRINAQYLESLPGEAKTYEAHDHAAVAWMLEKLDKNCRAPKSLDLKVGAKVIFTANDVGEDRQYANGTRGIVESMEESEVRVRIASGVVVVAAPREYRYSEDVDARDLLLLEEPLPAVPELPEDDPEYDPGADPVYAAAERAYDAAIAEREAARRRVDDKSATRSQIPLRVAAAVSVHRSQGSTLDSARIDVSRAFAAGQTYVAMSRVRSEDGLFLEGFSPRSIFADPKIVHRILQAKGMAWR